MKKDVVIIARDGENILYKRKAIKVNPGEIEKVTVNTSGIKELVVEVKDIDVICYDKKEA